MRTYTHGIIGYLLYSSASKRAKILAVIGGIVPDIILGVGYIFHYITGGIFDMLHELLHRGALHEVTKAMHSFVIVLPLLLLAYLFAKPYIPLFVGMLVHGLFDLLTHQRSAYNHFYPLPLSPLSSPVAYTALWFIIL